MDFEKKNASIGEKIRTMRTRKGYSQENMASLLEMSTNGYARIELDKSPELSIKRLEQIAEVLGTNLHELLLQGSEEMSYISGNCPNVTADSIGDNSAVFSYVINNNVPKDYQLLQQEAVFLKDKLRLLEEKNQQLERLVGLLEKK